jgi:hypothetical protein
MIQVMHMFISMGCRCTFCANKKVSTSIGRPTLPEAIWNATHRFRKP